MENIFTITLRFSKRNLVLFVLVSVIFFYFTPQTFSSHCERPGEPGCSGGPLGNGNGRGNGGSNFIAGQLYYDPDNNGKLDSREKTYPSGNIHISGPVTETNSVYDPSTGRYQFDNLPEGTYTVTWLDPPSGSSTPSYTVTLGSFCSVGGNKDANCTGGGDVNDLTIGYTFPSLCDPSVQCSQIAPPSGGWTCTTAPYNAAPNTCSCNGVVGCAPNKTMPPAFLKLCTYNNCNSGSICSSGSCVDCSSQGTCFLGFGCPGSTVCSGFPLGQCYNAACNISSPSPTAAPTSAPTSAPTATNTPTLTPTLTPGATSALPTFTPVPTVPPTLTVAPTVTPFLPSLSCPSGWYYVKHSN